MNVIITGANRGIGKAMVEAFAMSGYNVWACARKPSSDFENWLRQTALANQIWIRPVYFELTDMASLDEGIRTILDE